MKRIILSLVLLIPVIAKSGDVVELTPLQVVSQFDDNTGEKLYNLIDKEDSINACIVEYIRTESRSYSRIVQNNLYDLAYNFSKIISKVYGKKILSDNISFDEKLRVMARAQCEEYYTIEHSR